MTAGELERRLRHRVSRDGLLRAARESAADRAVPLWLVGGFVRDAALGRTAVDVDLVAGPGTSALVSALARSWGRRGFRFRKRGVTTWRFRVGDREIDLVDAGRRGLERDLLRREFTLNAIAFDLIERRLADPLSGLRDLRAGRLRLPRDGVIREDPIRALRAARFLAQFPAFRLDRRAARECAAVSRGLRRASAERVRDELNRLLTASAPTRGLEALDRLGLLRAVLPELAPLRNCVAGRDRPDVWRHTLDALALSARPGRMPGAAAVRDRSARLGVGWALLLHDLAKPETLAHAPDGRPTFHGHEVIGSRGSDALLRRLRQPSRLRRRVRRLVRFHLRPHHLADAGAPARGMRRLVREAEEDLPSLLLLAACDARASGAPDAARRWRRLRPVLAELDNLYRRGQRKPSRPLISGHDVMTALGISPGRQVGDWLERVRGLQDEGALRTREEALEWLKRRGAPRRGRGSSR